MNGVCDISVIVCTCNRAASLAETLGCFAKADRVGLAVEIVVVDNNSSDHTKQVVASFERRLPVRYLWEPIQGKSHALNRALAEGDLGQIIAVLDDDMSPHSDWFKGVAAICDRWPDKDMFSGKSYIIWPDEPVPGWARCPNLAGWNFSVMDFGPKDQVLKDGRWLSGNHFWFRSRVLRNGRKFDHLWLTEPKFMLDLAEEESRGVIAPDAVAGHRIQPQLLDRAVVRKRALKVGRSFAELRLRPFKAKVKQSALLRRHPVLGRLCCIAAVLKWSCCYLSSFCWLSPARRFEQQIVALERIATYWESLRVANEMPEYGVFRRRVTR